jgi:hypothetical protein
MNEFTEITVKCVWTTIKGRIWRAQYRLRSKAVRKQSKAIYRALKNENKPRIYRVEIRTGQRSPFSQRARTLMEVDLKLIYRAIREAIQKDMRGDEDKRVYTVAYKIYDIKAIHHYEVHEEQGGDSYMDICETYFKVDRDTIEIIEVKDIDGGMHAGQLHRLKEYGEQNNL